MTLEQDWKIGKAVLKSGGKLVLSDAPRWIRDAAHDTQRFYALRVVKRDREGFPLRSDADYLFLTDQHRDRIAQEQERRDAIGRSKKSLWIALAAFLLSLVSIAWQICTWIAERG